MPPGQRGRAIGAVLAGIGGVAHPDRDPVDQRQNGGDGEVELARLAGEIAADAAADRRQGRAELCEVVELVCLAPGAPVGVVAVLLAGPRVLPGGLQVAMRLGADPDVLVGRRHRERVEASALRPARDGGAVRGGVGEPAPAPLASDAGFAVGIVDKLGGGRHRRISSTVQRHLARCRSGSRDHARARRARAAGFAASP